MFYYFGADRKIRKAISERQVLDIALYKIGVRNPSLRSVKVPSIDVNANDFRGPNESGDQSRSTPNIKSEL